MTTFAEWKPSVLDPPGREMPGMEDRAEWLTCLSRTRDSDLLAEANFEAALEMLGGESADVEVHRFGHWACGWIETIMVNPDSEEAVREWESIEAALSDYPVLDERRYHEMVSEKQTSNWRAWCARDLIRAIQRKLDLDEDTADRLEEMEDDYRLRVWFEDGDGMEGGAWDDDSPMITQFVEALTLEGLLEFLNEAEANAVVPDQPFIPGLLE